MVHPSMKTEQALPLLPHDQFDLGLSPKLLA